MRAIWEHFCDYSQLVSGDHTINRTHIFVIARLSPALERMQTRHNPTPCPHPYANDACVAAIRSSAVKFIESGVTDT